MKPVHEVTEFADVFECYEAIGRWLSEEAPEPWREITVEFGIIAIDDVSEYVITYRPSGWRLWKRRQFFIDNTNFDNCFFSLAKLISTADKGFFRKCKYVLKKDGSYAISFEY